jgi:hypothetical protein
VIPEAVVKSLPGVVEYLVSPQLVHDVLFPAVAGERVAGRTGSSDDQDQ